MVAFSEAPKTVNRETTATPIIRALAVAAVRSGLRRALRLASPPVTPRSRSSGAPRARTADVDATGPSTTNDARTSTAPTPARVIDGDTRTPTRVTAIAAAPSTPPMTARRREAPESSTELSRRAASGAVRPARRAGSSAEPTHTTMPTASGSSMDSGPITKSPSGNGNPMTGNSAWSPAAMPIPPASPAAEATTATAVASTRVAAAICRRAAPSALNRAFSRARWATTMAKVLWMEKVATSSATPENTRRKVVNRLRNWPEIMSVFSCTDSSPVIASTPLGSWAVRLSTSSCWLTPGPART